MIKIIYLKKQATGYKNSNFLWRSMEILLSQAMLGCVKTVKKETISIGKKKLH